MLRNVTERPEGVEAGTLKLAGTDENVIYSMAKELLDNKEEYEKMAQAKNPFGDGQASRRIVESILYAFGKKADRPDEYVLRIKYEKTPKEGKPMKEERNGNPEYASKKASSAWMRQNVCLQRCIAA